MASRLLSNTFLKNTLCGRHTACGIIQQLLYSTDPDLLTKETLFTKLPVKEISPTCNDQIAGRKWLPGSHGRGFPKYLAKPREDFPHALMAKSADMYSIDEIAKVTRQVIDEDLPKYGAVLFRGLTLYDVQDFANFSLALGYKSMEYTGGAGNRQIVNTQSQIYTASDDPSAYTIELHNELAYSPTYPRKLMFYCVDEPGEGCGGYTVLCKSSDFVPNIHPDVIKKLEEKQVRYQHRVPDQASSKYSSWQKRFNTTDKKIVESFLEKKGFTYKWEDKSLSYWNILPAFIPHPDTGEKTWFNHVHRKHISSYRESPMFPGDDHLDTSYVFGSFYGDGSEIEPEVIQHIRECIWNSTVGFQWRQEDVLLVDNLTTLHGRLGFNGKRKILANLFED
ncbi:dapdiamide synthesis protein DdaC [Nematostella vectensis]|uniref:dapdiamide synthesis protein DdaC n=1 Tax=Nematostella vectensis TaxID=45351 RepID=UPI00138FC94E|nr:dapdiamide synthesis protein DdaC [Nematostella vectensis]XP_032221165.1 dapdiamide synthesis protein DdaC [Nematostella vectensis]XP_048576025.1 dapdiamide synthesis protein DdaC [Nematostella vectensis]XP_048576026.1 dapdiamide synthesis protein DdaC [Nematostella vectensis]